MVNATHPHTDLVGAVFACAASTLTRSRQMLTDLVLTVLLDACGTDRSAQSEVAETDLHACTQVAAPLANVATRDAEPRMRIPQPPGWEYSAERDSADSVRFTLFRPGPVAAESPHNVVLVSLEPAPDADAQTILTGFEMVPVAASKPS